VPTSDPRFPARFDAQAWGEDLTRSTPAGVAAAHAARAEYERHGVPLSQLRPCETEARDGTSLDQCLKVYLPPLTGHFGMVFSLDVQGDGLILLFLAFGVRHHPTDSNAATVYQVADRRLHQQ
jgi:hypothetical protein